MKVVIIGGGRTSAQLAKLLHEENHEIRLIEFRKEILGNLHKELPSELIVEGDPVETNVLEEAGIAEADVLAATSTLDQVNLVLCYIARERYKVPRTIARVNNPSNAWLFNENFHVDVAVNQAEITAALIGEEMSLGDMVTLVKIRRGNYAIVEEKVMDGARAIGIEIRNLGLPEDCVLAAIVREGKVIIPRGVTSIEPGDEVIAITDLAGAHFLEDLLSGSGKK